MSIKCHKQSLLDEGGHGNDLCYCVCQPAMHITTTGSNAKNKKNFPVIFSKMLIWAKTFNAEIE